MKYYIMKFFIRYCDISNVFDNTKFNIKYDINKRKLCCEYYFILQQALNLLYNVF